MDGKHSRAARARIVERESIGKVLARKKSFTKKGKKKRRVLKKEGERCKHCGHRTGWKKGERKRMEKKAKNIFFWSHHHHHQQHRGVWMCVYTCVSVLVNTNQTAFKEMMLQGLVQKYWQWKGKIMLQK